jgi:large subunit ribosomal protein L21
MPVYLLTRPEEGVFMTYAVVEIAGQQFKVSKSDTIHVPKIESEVGQKLTFGKVLLVGDDKQTKIGAPYLDGTQVEAKVVGHVKDDKVTVFKKKKRKGYKVHRGHRQMYTEIEITKVA